MDSQHGLDDREAERKALERLSRLGDPLERIARLQWYRFSPLVAKAFEGEKRPAGAAAYSDLMLLKILILQRLCGLSAEEIAFEIRDALSFMRFLDLHIDDRKPDAETIRRFGEALAEAHVLDKIFHLLDELMKEEGITDYKKYRELSIFTHMRERRK